MFAGGAALLVAFVFAERRAAEPILPLWVFSRRLLATTTFLALGIGVMLIGLASYVPTYLENALGVSPLVAGLALAALTLGWPLAASVSGRLFYLRLGFRPTVLIGLGLVVAGTGALALLAHRPSVAIVAVTCFVTGLGMGLVATPSLIAAQASVGWNERGVATGTNMFARSLGSAVGAAVLGAVANGVVAASGRPETDPVGRDGIRSRGVLRGAGGGPADGRRRPADAEGARTGRGEEGGADRRGDRLGLKSWKGGPTRCARLPPDRGSPHQRVPAVDDHDMPGHVRVAK